MFRKARDARIGKGRNGGVVLVEVLERESVFGAGVVIEVGDCVVAGKTAGPRDKRVIDMGACRSYAVQAVIGDEPLSWLPWQGRRVEQDERKRIDVGVGEGGAERIVGQHRESIGGTIVAQPHRNVEERVPKFGVGDVQVLVANEVEEPVFDERSAEGSASNVAVQLRRFVVRRNVGILVEEEGGRIDPVCAAVDVGLAMDGIGSRGSA